MHRFSIHPLFFLMMIFETLLGNLYMSVVALTSAIIHELGHGMVAKLYGYEISEIKIMPYGAAIATDCNMSRKSAIPILLAGPITSGLIAILFVAFWWIFPAIYPYTLDIFKTNLVLALFNLLPAHPLDGGRILYCLIKTKRNADRVMHIISASIGTIIGVTGMISLFFTPNFSLILVGGIIVAMSNDSIKTNYRGLASGITLEKSTTHPLHTKTIIAYGDTKLYKLLLELNKYEVITFKLRETRDSKGYKLISEEELVARCLALPATATTKDLLRIV